MSTKLWTIQDEQAWHSLNSQGVLKTTFCHIDPDYLEGYTWLKKQMTDRIGPPESKDQFPVWAWYQCHYADKKKPDLRTSGLLPKGEIGYRIEIEKKQEDILLSDFQLWHFPLAYKSYIADNEEAALLFEEALVKKYGTDSYAALPRHIQTEIEQSWEKIFDMHYDEEYATVTFDKKSIQATFWELRREEIVKVDRFIAR